ncbi:ROK family protein [Tropicimonas sp.]|uniref:ROK family transcriptional regulator n=1 Tax=Tropicimonas sp. TaxID=2067044 RepID=UPI003A86F178
MDSFSGKIIYRLLSGGGPRTSSEIESLTGTSRVTVARRLGALTDSGLIRESGHAEPVGGRPARTFAIDPGYRNLIGIDIGERMARICLFDLALGHLGDRLVPLDLTQPPDTTMKRLLAQAAALAESPAATAPVAAYGIGLPAPVDQKCGRVAAPSIMYGWERFDLRDWLGERLDIPVALDNDVNLMCQAEHRLHWPDCRNMVFIKAGTGIGCGIINDGRLVRGAGGASGDIGHIQHADPPHHLCRCGKLGCIEAHAGGWAVARDLTALGLKATDARDVMEHYARGEPECRKAINRSSRIIGTAAADLVAILNPEVIVLGGRLATAGEAMLAGIRERVYQRCLPLATEKLRIATARCDERLGAAGAAMLAMDAAISGDGWLSFAAP